MSVRRDPGSSGCSGLAALPRAYLLSHSYPELAREQMVPLAKGESHVVLDLLLHHLCVLPGVREVWQLRGCLERGGLHSPACALTGLWNVRTLALESFAWAREERPIPAGSPTAPALEQAVCVLA